MPLNGAETGSLAPVPRIPERLQPIPDSLATIHAPPRPAPQERLIAKIARRGMAWRGSAVQVVAAPVCTTPVDSWSAG